MTPTNTDQPLYLLDILTLGDLDTPEGYEAIKIRGHAFHEAGHAWAANRADLPLRPATLAHDSDPYVGVSGFATAWLAALGPLTQGVAVEADIYSYNEETFHESNPWLQYSDVYDIWQHTAEVREETCCCRRGGDHGAEDMLDDKHWVGLQTLPLVRDWNRIDALARRLMTGAVVEPNEIRSLLGS